MKASEFFTKEQQEKIRDAIKEAEDKTSGEIRIHIETKTTGNVLDRAAWIFKRLGLHGTAERNGVLFYLAITNRKFAVIGDQGINSKVAEDFWDEIKETVSHHFSTGQFTEGLVRGISMTGSQLKVHFPFRKDDVNELPDDISFDDPSLTGVV
jgi:uncharacterized membrane protein